MNYVNTLKQPVDFGKPDKQNFPWREVDKVFFDLDGTLLDRYFDDYFWEQFVPEVYSSKNKIDIDQSRQLLIMTYKSVQNTLQWTDLDYWSEKLGLDIAALKYEVRHLIQSRPQVTELMNHIKSLGKEIYLVTNAHPKALQIKMEQVDLTNWFKARICSKEVGAAKEQPEFWHKFMKIIPFEKDTTLFVDDNTKVLETAREFGIKHLVHIAKPSSKVAAQYCNQYRSIGNFQELIR